jgi:hypothetical protein
MRDTPAFSNTYDFNPRIFEVGIPPTQINAHILTAYKSPSRPKDCVDIGLFQALQSTNFREKHPDWEVSHNFLISSHPIYEKT